MLRSVCALALLLASTLSFAYSVTIEHSVDSRDNLYYTDWGHWFTTAEDNALANTGSNPARAVSLDGPFFNFAGFDTVSIDAWGAVIDHFDIATGPNGCIDSPLCPFSDGDFRNLPAYALIGIWSSSATEIVPFGDWLDTESGLGLMFIGEHIDLSIPEFNAAYLFLAENDGGFADNSGKYDVRLAARVPEPSALGLLSVGLLALQFMRRRS